MLKEKLKPSIESKIAVIGLGYVGFPLAIEFAKNRPVIGFDTKESRINEINELVDKNNQISSEEIKLAEHLVCTSSIEKLVEAKIFIITVPTPLLDKNKPDLSHLISATKTVGKLLKKGDVVIYESTVYPGVTSNICTPILEDVSKLIHNHDFFTGYSPERINPGDTKNTITQVKKVTSGSTPETAEFIDSLYQEIISAGTHKAPSIEVAEAAKVIENTQRDVNIALMNELSKIFSKMGLDTGDVLQAANTKWNFLDFKPGLVGGHCIGIDPYYLVHIAEELDCDSKMIVSGRETNDGMSKYVSDQILTSLKTKDLEIQNSKVLIFGLTFKEDIPDIRNTKVLDIFKRLSKAGCLVDIYDNNADPEEVEELLEIKLVKKIEKNTYDVIVLAVPHQEIIGKGLSYIKSFGKDEHLFFDLKMVFNKEDSDFRL